MSEKEQRIIVVGGGPGGYVAAIEASHCGAKVTLIEKDALGGTCVNRGCIPTKALVQTANMLHEIGRAGEYGIVVNGYALDFIKASERKSKIVKQLRDGVAYLMKKNKITVLHGTASILDSGRVLVSGNERQEISADKIIIASGSQPGSIPVEGVEDKGVMNSDDALEMKILPKKMVVIGGGVIGLEFAQIFKRMSVDVSVIEMMPQILPTEDHDIARHLERALKKEGIDIYVNAKVACITTAPSGEKQVLFTVNGIEKALECEKALVAVGRVPYTEGLGLEQIGIALEKGRIPVNERMETTVKNVYAIGDAAGGLMLAHKAMAEGRCAAKNALGIESAMNYKAVPRCIWTSPEVAAVGLTELQAREQHDDVKVGSFPFTANGKAKIIGETQGFVKIISESRYGEILGVHILGPHATEMIAESVLGMQMEASFHCLNETIHPHPTLSEALVEAGLGLEGKSIHI
ncbi:MAG: dihydrolipoyl dehydrogenase [Deltaproteobacteria bacterium]|nr:dihydrolipoyl dehydrogenase [Deltaproteobacteria bacterium]